MRSRMTPSVSCRPAISVRTNASNLLRGRRASARSPHRQRRGYPALERAMPAAGAVSMMRARPPSRVRVHRPDGPAARPPQRVSRRVAEAAQRRRFRPCATTTRGARRRRRCRPACASATSRRSPPATLVPRPRRRAALGDPAPAARREFTASARGASSGKSAIALTGSATSNARASAMRLAPARAGAIARRLPAFAASASRTTPPPSRANRAICGPIVPSTVSSATICSRSAPCLSMRRSPASHRRPAPRTPAHPHSIPAPPARRRRTSPPILRVRR